MEENYQYYLDFDTGEISTEGINRILTFPNQPTIYSWIPNDPVNKDWKRFQQWLAEGNTPLPPN